jgi:hypothetical protein
MGAHLTHVVGHQKSDSKCDSSTYSSPNNVVLTLFRPTQLASITAIAENREGEGGVEIRCKYYLRPDQTHLGQQVRAAEVGSP